MAGIAMGTMGVVGLSISLISPELSRVGSFAAWVWKLSSTLSFESSMLFTSLLRVPDPLNTLPDRPGPKFGLAAGDGLGPPAALVPTGTTRRVVVTPELPIEEMVADRCASGVVLPA